MMTRRDRITYSNDREFKRFLATKFETFDLDKSLDMNKFSFATTDGNTYKCLSAVSMFRHLNKVFGKFINTTKSKVVKRKYLILYLEKDFANKETTVEVEETNTDTVTFSEEYAESLYDEEDKSESKNKLEAYGLTFGINLKKNKSFENMLKDLVEFCKG